MTEMPDTQDQKLVVHRQERVGAPAVEVWGSDGPLKALPVAEGSEVEPIEPCGSDIGVFSPRRCVLPKGHGGDWHDDGSACWSVEEPSDAADQA